MPNVKSVGAASPRLAERVWNRPRVGTDTAQEGRHLAGPAGRGGRRTTSNASVPVNGLARFIDSVQVERFYEGLEQISRRMCRFLAMRLQ